VMLLLLTACGLAVTLALTARRTQVAPATLAIGAGTGLALGAAMYTLDPLGSNFKFPDRPWLHGSAVDPVAALAWILLFGAPLVAGVIAGRRCHLADDPQQAAAARVRQGLAAGLVSGGVGAAFVTVLGTGTTALLVKSAQVRGLLYHGQHLTASAVYGRELFATQDLAGYLFMCVAFPIIGAMLGAAGATSRQMLYETVNPEQRAPQPILPAPEPILPAPEPILPAPEPILTWWGGNRRIKPTE
jgi:hypothetical protein